MRLYTDNSQAADIAEAFSGAYAEFIAQDDKYLYVSESDFNDVEWKNGDFDMLINKLLGE